MILQPDQGRWLEAVQLACRGGEGPHLEAEAFEDLTEMQQGNATEAAVAVEQHLFDRVAGEGEAVAAGQALEADQGTVEGGVAPFAQGRQLQADAAQAQLRGIDRVCLLYTSPSPRDRQKSRMPSSA